MRVYALYAFQNLIYIDHRANSSVFNFLYVRSLLAPKMNCASVKLTYSYIHPELKTLE